ncbi:hypothetical protein K2X33_04250 [bacterium]|nr:hypothetical protein [bacterium]
MELVGKTFFRIFFLLLVSAPAMAAVPSVVVTIRGQQEEFLFPETAQATETLLKLSAEQRTKLHERRKFFLVTASRVMSEWIRVSYYSQPLAATLATVFGVQWTFLPTSYFQHVTRHTLEKLDTVLCENAELTVKVDRFGAGIGIVGAYGAAMETKAHGHSLVSFFSLDSNLGLNSYRLRFGSDRERLVLGTPAYLSGGLALRFFIYMTHSESGDKEHGTVLYPGVGPSYMVTNHSLAIRKTYGFWIPSLVTIVAQTKIVRTQTTPRAVWKTTVQKLSSCAAWVFTLGRNKPQE